MILRLVNTLMQNSEAGSHLPHTNLEEIRDLDVRAKVIKLVEDNRRVNLCYLGLGNGFKVITTNA